MKRCLSLTDCQCTCAVCGRRGRCDFTSALALISPTAVFDATCILLPAARGFQAEDDDFDECTRRAQWPIDSAVAGYNVCRQTFHCDDVPFNSDTNETGGREVCVVNQKWNLLVSREHLDRLLLNYANGQILISSEQWLS